MNISLSDISAEAIGLNQKEYVDDKELTSEYLDIFLNPDSSYESYLLESCVLFGEASVDSQLFDYEDFDLSNKVRLSEKLNKYLSNENHGTSATNILDKEYNKHKDDSFFDKMVENIKRVIHKLILSFGNFIRSIMNYVKSANSKYISHFYKTKLKDVKESLKKNQKTFDEKKITITAKSETEIFHYDPVVILNGVNKFMNVAIMTFHNKTLNNTNIKTLLKNVGIQSVVELLMNSDFREIFRNLRETFKQSNTLAKLQTDFKTRIPTIGRIKRCILYNETSNIKVSVSYSTMFNKLQNTMSDNFISATKLMTIQGKMQIKAFSKLLNCLQKSVKETKGKDSETYRKELYYCNTCKHMLIMLTGLILSIYGDLLTMRNKTYSISKKILKEKKKS